MDAPEHRLPPTPAPSPEALHEILEHFQRRQRWRRTMFVLALVGFVVLAGLVSSVIQRAVSDDTAFGRADGVDTRETFSVPVTPEAPTGEGGLRRLGIRTTDADIALRLYVSDDPPRNCAANEPCPPPDCLPHTLQGEMSNRESVGTIGAWVEAVPAPGQLLPLGSMEFGTVEGAPATAVLAAAGEGIKRVRLRSGDQIDESAPTETFVLLAVPGQHPTPTLVGLDAEGREVATAQVSPEGQAQRLPSRCDPVAPALPPETDPPADRAAAEQAVRDVAELVYSASDGQVSDKLEWIEDGEELRSVQDELEERYGGNQADVSITIDEVSFQGPDRATFRYDFFLGGNVLLTDHLGQAVLQDGTWKIGRDMWCSMNQRGGVTCPAR